MPNKPSAKKALRQSKKREQINNLVKKTYKDALKTARKAVSVGQEDAKTLVIVAQKKLGKATKNGVISKKTAARKLSRLMKKAYATVQK